MTIRYEPKKVLARMASKKNIEKLVTDRLTTNRVALNALDNSGIVGKSELQNVALRVLKDYRERAEVLREEQGITKKEAYEQLAEDPKLMVQQIQNATVYQITQSVKDKFFGEYYTWLPSTAAVPDKKHMRKYGKTFQLGRGEAPGDRFGCRCGMEIHVPQKRLNLD